MTVKRKIHIAVSWLLVLLCMVIIFLLSAQAADESQALSDSFILKIFEYIGVVFSSELIRTTAHALEFMGLSVLIFNAVYVTWRHRFTFLFAFSGTVLYAISDEIHQIFVEGRAFQLSDILVDSTGAFIGALASFVILKIILYKYYSADKRKPI